VKKKYDVHTNNHLEKKKSFQVIMALLLYQFYLWQAFLVSGYYLGKQYASVFVSNFSLKSKPIDV